MDMQWQPIKTAPKDRNILLYGRYASDSQGWMDEALIGRWHPGEERWECVWAVWFFVRPTHWMPLPPPPPHA